MDTFLNKLAKKVIHQYGENLMDVVIILPNRRSKIFLISEIEKNVSQTVIAPSIYSIQEFTEIITGILPIDPIEALFEFYKIYGEVVEPSERQSFEQFAPWAKVLLKDYDEIDIHLIEPDKILKYLKEIKDIEHWSLSEKRTEIIEKHLKFWDMIPNLYHKFYQYLQQINKGYQGLIFREAASRIEEYANNKSNHKFVFAGFNALTPAEEKIIKHLLKQNVANIYFDSDRAFLENTYNLAGHFIRKIKSKWNYFNSNPFEWVFDEFSKVKNIEIIGTPKAIGQAKVVGEIMNNLISENPDNINATALVLSEKNLLIPVLYSLPDSVTNLNITLGYSAKNNPAQFLVNRLFKMHAYAKSKKGNQPIYYYKDVLEILTNPFVEVHIDSHRIIELIKQFNITFISSQKIFETHSSSGFLNLLFSEWPNEPLKILDILFEILQQIKAQLNQNNKEERVTKAFVYELYKILNRLKNYFSVNATIGDINTLYAIYKQIIDSAEVSFEGEPLSGLQIMGILESRSLDFENVIITSVNEGKIPFGKSQSSFIPYDVKREFGLQTYWERDAIYTYHFYRLLQRAKNVYLIYNTENEGIDAGEQSRFITQLKIEKQPQHTITEWLYNAELPTHSLSHTVVEKCEKVMLRLREIAEKGFSPSALATYIRNPIEFYYQKILRIDENIEVEETIEANTLGNIIHATLEMLYTPFIDKYLSVENVELFEKNYPTILLENFEKEFKEGDFKRGKNLLAYEAAKRSIANFLKWEKQSLWDGDAVKILKLEQHCERIIEDEKLPFPVKIGGNIDRIEERNGIIRIIDYKTGQVRKENLVLSNWNDFLSEPKKNKIIQLLSYVYMYEPYAENKEIETGIISFKNLSSGFMKFGFKYDKNDIQDTITPEIMEQFKKQMVALLTEILNQEIAFSDAEKQEFFS